MEVEIVVGIVFTIFGLYAFISEGWKRIVCKTLTTATIIHINAKRSWDSDDNRYVTYYYPVFEYFDENGYRYEKEHHSSLSSFSRKEVGDLVDIYYSESNPYLYYIKGAHDILFASIFLIIGIILLFFV